MWYLLTLLLDCQISMKCHFKTLSEGVSNAGGVGNGREGVSSAGGVGS